MARVSFLELRSYLVVVLDVVLLTVLGFSVDDGVGGALLGFVVQVHVGQVVVLVGLAVTSVLVLGLSVHVGHVVALVVDVVSGVVGRGLPSAASLWLVRVGGWGVTGCCGRLQSSNVDGDVDRRPSSTDSYVEIIDTVA